MGSCRDCRLLCERRRLAVRLRSFAAIVKQLFAMLGNSFAGLGAQYLMIHIVQNRNGCVAQFAEAFS